MNSDDQQKNQGTVHARRLIMLRFADGGFGAGAGLLLAAGAVAFRGSEKLALALCGVALLCFGVAIVLRVRIRSRSAEAESVAEGVAEEPDTTVYYPTLTFETPEGEQEIEMTRVAFVSSHGKRIVLHHELREYDVTASLAELEGSMGQFGFHRIHKQFIVNIFFLASLSRSGNGIYQAALMDSEDTLLPVGRKYLELVRELCKPVVSGSLTNSYRTGAGFVHLIQDGTALRGEYGPDINAEGPPPGKIVGTCIGNLVHHTWRDSLAHGRGFWIRKADGGLAGIYGFEDSPCNGGYWFLEPPV